MKIHVINEKAFESLLSKCEPAGTTSSGVLACDGGCSCDTGSDWVNTICRAPEWVVAWKKATC